MSPLVAAALTAQVIFVAAPELPGVPSVKVKTQRLDSKGKPQADQSTPPSAAPAAPLDADPMPPVKVKTLRIDRDGRQTPPTGQMQLSNPNASPR